MKKNILKKSAKRIAVMERSDCPSSIKEEAIVKRQTSKQILEIICGIQGIDVYTAIEILKETETIIRETIMMQKI